jgi:hypothetical protein
MPQRGPPPPSASYTWKFDDGTDDESTDSGDQIVGASRISEETILPVVVPSTSSSVDENDGVEDDKGDDLNTKEDEPEDDDSEWGSWAALIPSASKHKQQSSKNNKGKKSKNKKKKKQQQQKEKKKAVTVAVVKKNLSFGTVQIQRHERCLGIDVVPLDGSWPLGIGTRLVEHAIEELSVDQYEEQKQQQLRERLAKLDPAESARLRPPHNDVLETRQWDYRSSAKNPLFHLVTESNRMELLLRYSEPENGHDAVVERSADHHHKTSPSTSNNKQRKQLSSSSTRRDSSHAERFDDLFTKADVSHFRVELEDIRARRSIKDATGCSCHRLKVYLPPEHGTSGKTAQKKRLAVNKLKSELRKRNLLPKDNDHSASSSSREQLERILHDAVEKEGCCDYDCPCYQNGIGCQSDACDCWQQQPSSNDNITASSMTTQDIRDRCGNRHGMYTVDGTVIDEYRRNVLEKLTYCPPVQQQDEENHHTTAHTPQLLNHSNNKKFIGRNLPKLAT